MALALAFNSFAQSVKGEQITYTYVKLPSNPVQPKPTAYTATVTAAYEAENQKLLAQYEADKAQAKADVLAKLGLTADEVAALLS